jgi:hypothetical protein
MIKVILLVLGFAVLLFGEVLRVYFIMPFPGSQEDEVVQWAYIIHTQIGWIRLIGFLLLCYPLYGYLRQSPMWARATIAVVLGFYAVVFYMFNYKFLADKIFLQPENVTFLDAAHSKVSGKQLALGITIQGESKAYPIEIIGYHHQVRDVVGGEPVMVTYCTVCRTGRVYSPVVDGRPETFRLVGMDHYNAMFEDATTHSWWRQVSGEAIVGEKRGARLKEIESAQMTIDEWVNLHPTTVILQPDGKFTKAYYELKDYDEGTRKGRLERKDSVSWMDKSWIVGVQLGMSSRAYDWIQLQQLRVVNDTINRAPVVVTISRDSLSHYVLYRMVEADTLHFMLQEDGRIIDEGGSIWSPEGRCIEGARIGKALTPVPSYQEYWHSWRTFHPQSTRYIP